MTSAQMSACAGVSPRQLQWWDERGVVRPLHVRHNRVYEYLNALDVLFVSELRTRKMSLQMIRGFLKTFRSGVLRYASTELELRDRADHREILLLLSADGRNMQFMREGAELLGVLRASNKAYHVISITDLLERIKRPMRREPRVF
jgi:DNA-binding transcriptional MerR regulator